MAKGWLDNYGKQENYNNSKTSVPKGYVGEGYDITGRNYSPAWGGQFQNGGTKKKVLKTTDKVVKSSFIGKMLDFIPGAETIYDVNNVLEGLNEGDYKKIGANTVGALLPGVSGKAFEAVVEDWLPPTPEIEKKKMQFNLNSSPADRQKYLKKYGPGYLNNPQFIKDQKLQMGGSIPGAVGFSYARTNNPAPSNGPYAKKTMASAKSGKVIKDDRGQWAHPGEITEIGSNQITMKGVPYPVLGISDTGDTQMMYPEEEYEFDGTKVTEFPMAKNGLRQEQKGLVNLDNLLNFTNYNTKQPGGWLDKY